MDLRQLLLHPGVLLMRQFRQSGCPARQAVCRQGLIESLLEGNASLLTVAHKRTGAVDTAEELPGEEVVIEHAKRARVSVAARWRKGQRRKSANGELSGD